MNEDFKLDNLFNILKNHISLILIGVSIIGGLGQFYNLVNISSELLNFYSVGQVLIKGLYYLLLTLLSFITTFIIVYLLMLIDESKYSVLNKTFLLIVLLVAQIGLVLYNIDLAISLVISIALTATMFVRVFIPNPEKNDVKKEKFSYDIFFYLLLLIFSLIFIKYEVVNYIFPNSTTLKIKTIACKSDSDCYELKYFNDKYAFYVTVDNDGEKSKDSKVLILKLDDVLNYKEIKIYDNKSEFYKLKNDSIKKINKIADSIRQKKRNDIDKKFDSILNEIKTNM